MKTIVIYKSKIGFTKKYADWIAESLSSDIYEVSKVNIDMLSSYDTIIYGGSLYAGGILGVKIITENIDKLNDKKVIVFATGASPLKESVVNEVKNKNFTNDQLNCIKFFYMRGGFDFSKLNLVDKFLMNMLKWKIKSKGKEKLTGDEIGMLSIYDKPVDYTLKKNIDSIINYVNQK